MKFTTTVHDTAYAVVQEHVEVLAIKCYFLLFFFFIILLLIHLFLICVIVIMMVYIILQILSIFI